MHTCGLNKFEGSRNVSVCVRARARVCVLLTAWSCDVEFTANSEVNGTFTSPGFPRSYPDDVTCRYRFTGNRGDRVQLRFAAFNLVHSASDSKSRKTALPVCETL